MASSEAKGNIRILVVEDDPSYLYLIKRCLDECYHCHFEIDYAADLKDAFQRISQGGYHMVLTEETVGGRKGVELLQELHEVQMDIPFVLMTAVRNDQVAREAANIGVSQILIKSESQFHDLSFMLNDLLERYCRMHPTFQAKIMHGDFEKKRRYENEGDWDVFSSFRDSMTGVFSHSFFHERLAGEFASASRHGYPIACLFLDIDNFKELNEQYGYRIGDEVLRECAKLLFKNCRMTDVPARFGGEKFVLLLPHTAYQGAMEVATRLQDVVGKYTFLPREHQIQITLSFGVSSFPEDYIEKRFDVLSYAKQAHFHSKITGRHRITRYKDLLPKFGEQIPRLLISEDKVLEYQRRLSEIADFARKNCLDASRTLLQALEAKDQATAKHSIETSRYATKVAEFMNMTPHEVDVIRHAALLHDIGKLCVPDTLLFKESKLNFSEYEAMKQHPYLGYKILKPIKLLQEEALIVLHHHEWFNGEGYPCQLKGNEIPMGARIISVIDTFETLMVSGKRYRGDTETVDEIVRELNRCAGTQFDPAVVKVFVSLLEKEGLLKPADAEISESENRLRDSA